MSDFVPVKIGDHAVIYRRWRNAVVEVMKVTDKQIKGAGEFGLGRHSTYQRGDILFAGSKARAEQLATDLGASRDRYDAEVRDASERRMRLDEQLIEAAKHLEQRQSTEGSHRSAQRE